MYKKLLNNLCLCLLIVSLFTMGGFNQLHRTQTKLESKSSISNKKNIKPHLLHLIDPDNRDH
ncbi:hypothetical protein ACFIJ5_18635 (plasmid) [Haloimpatiens sp. FM7330]|uniref:hypothetical protein n=1 Tax=Haloimpatiens sp. FM7330 TaxID=3298610 RepID=UPI0036292FA5